MSDNETDSSSTTNTSDAEKKQQIKKMIQERIGKRLAYLLRYGAVKEGLNVVTGGFVKLAEVMNSPLLKRHENDGEYVLEELKSSLSHRKINRFETKEINGEIYVRATYGRKFERSPYHLDTKVPRFLELCLDYVTKNINNYDFEGFPDEYIINEIIHRLKRSKKLNAKILESLLSNDLEHLDFDGIFLTEKIMKLVATQCKKLRILSLKDCGYVLNDHYLELLIKNCKLIESLNLSYCKDLTDRSLKNISKYIPNVAILKICGNANYTEAALVDLVKTCSNLKQLDIFDNKNITENGMNMITKIAMDRNQEPSLKIIHKDYSDNVMAPQKPWFD